MRLFFILCRHLNVNRHIYVVRELFLFTFSCEVGCSQIPRVYFYFACAHFYTCLLCKLIHTIKQTAKIVNSQQLCIIINKLCWEEYYGFCICLMYQGRTLCCDGQGYCQWWIDSSDHFFRSYFISVSKLYQGSSRYKYYENIAFRYTLFYSTRYLIMCFHAKLVSEIYNDNTVFFFDNVCVLHRPYVSHIRHNIPYSW